jgi:N-acetylmuramoyl-L-alanine amidase
MPTGRQLLAKAETRLGEVYRNVLVPKDNPNWHGPWDCAEFASWVVYQIVGKLYGCTNNRGNPATVEAYSGAWVDDARSGRLIAINQSTANITPGAILIRRPPAAGRMGHVAISDGRGRTVEAAGTNLGVRRGDIEGRQWHHCVLIPEVDYTQTNAVIEAVPLPFLLQLKRPNITSPLVRKVQIALRDAGFDPGRIDSTYGPHTAAAVAAFQTGNRLVADGVVGPSTAAKLGIEWPA